MLQKRNRTLCSQEGSPVAFIHFWKKLPHPKQDLDGSDSLWLNIQCGTGPARQDTAQLPLQVHVRICPSTCTENVREVESSVTSYWAEQQVVTAPVVNSGTVSHHCGLATRTLSLPRSKIPPSAI